MLAVEDWIYERQRELNEEIKNSKHYPEALIVEWSFLDNMLSVWKDNYRRLI